MEYLTQFYGTDWLAAVTLLLFTYFMSNKNKLGFIFGVISGLSWIAFGFISESMATIIANTIFVFLNIRGLLKWKKNSRQGSLPASPT